MTQHKSKEEALASLLAKIQTRRPTTTMYEVEAMCESVLNGITIVNKFAEEGEYLIMYVADEGDRLKMEWCHNNGAAASIIKRRADAGYKVQIVSDDPNFVAEWEKFEQEQVSKIKSAKA